MSGLQDVLGLATVFLLTISRRDGRGPYSLTSERSEAARMWTGQFGIHNVSLTRSTLEQQLHSLLSLDILVMPNFNFCFKKKLPSTTGPIGRMSESNLLAVNIELSMSATMLIEEFDPGSA